MAILVTGGAGYIGSHTVVELLEAGEDIVIVDNFVNSKPEALDKIKKITGKDFKFYEVDILDEEKLEKVLFKTYLWRPRRGRNGGKNDLFAYSKLGLNNFVLSKENTYDDYNKILKNRNAYLKELYLNSNGSLEYLNILTQKLITLGMEICKIRGSFIDNINKNLTSIYKNIFDYGNLEIKYRSDYKNKSYEDLENVYKKNLKTELNYRKTMIGVHHDDFDFILDGYNIKEYGSVGQQKNAIISFKLAELILIKLINGSYPILILDDLFSELDSIKINNIIKMLNKEVQTFITTTDINDVDKSLLEESNIYYANNGQIERKN